MAVEVAANDVTPPEVRLKRRLGLIHGISIVCGLVIGSGIYVAPKGVLLYTRSTGLSLVLWLLGGVLSILGGLTYAELGTTFPGAGGNYVYLDRLYGRPVAFLFQWMYTLAIRPGNNAIKALTFARCILKPIFPDCPIAEEAQIAIAILMSCLLTTVNCFKVQWAVRGQVFISAANVLSLVVIVGIGLGHMASGHTERLDGAFSDISVSAMDVCLGFYAVLFAVSGWKALNVMTEEVKNPKRNLPLAIVTSMCLVTTLYFLVNLAYFAVLDPADILASEAVAVTFGNRAMGMFSVLISVFIAINMAGSYNCGTLIGSRMAFAGARRGDLPEAMGLIHVTHLSPMVSLVFQAVMPGIESGGLDLSDHELVDAFLTMKCVLTAAFCIFVDLYTLLASLTFSLVLFDALTVGGWIVMRLRRPQLHRPIKVHLVIPCLYLACQVPLIVVPLAYRSQMALIATGLLLGTGLPYYVIFVLWTPKPKIYTDVVAKWTIFIQKLFMSVPQEGKVAF